VQILGIPAAPTRERAVEISRIQAL